MKQKKLIVALLALTNLMGTGSGVNPSLTTYTNSNQNLNVQYRTPMKANNPYLEDFPNLIQYGDYFSQKEIDDGLVEQKMESELYKYGYTTTIYPDALLTSADDFAFLHIKSGTFSLFFKFKDEDSMLKLNQLPISSNDISLFKSMTSVSKNQLQIITLLNTSGRTNLDAGTTLTDANYFGPLTETEDPDGTLGSGIVSNQCFVGANGSTNDLLIRVKTSELEYIKIGNMNAANHTLGKDVFINNVIDTDATYDDILLDGQTKTITVNRSANYTEEELVDMVSAKDLFGVDCEVVVEESDYQVGQIGTYTIKLKATDSYGQTAHATLKVVVIDKTPPVILKKQDLEVEYGTTVTEDQIKACFTASDDSGIEPTLTIVDKGGYDFSQAAPAVVKDYTIKVRATDDAGNTADATMTLKIVDRTGPTITKKDGTTTDVVKYGYSESYLLNESTLLNLYQATDVVDSECDVYIKSGEIDSSIGQHQITIAAKDLSNNETELLVKYEILADIPPVFILDSRLVNTSADSPLTREQIEQVAKAIAPEGATLVTLTNETQISNYQSNYNSSGSKYRIDYAYQDADGLPKTDYFYLQPGDTYVEEEEKSGWDKFWEGFCEFFEKLGNWFRGVFTKFKFDCFITNSEWDARFPN